MLYVPRNVSLIQKVENIIFLQFIMLNMESSLRRRKEALQLGCQHSLFSLTFIHDAVVPTHTSLCHRLLSLSDAPEVYSMCSRPAVCVYLHGASLYQQHTVRVRNSRSSIHLVPPWFVCCFPLLPTTKKTTAWLFYLVENLDSIKWTNVLSKKKKKKICS